MIEFKHVYKTYGNDSHSLRDISFKIDKGEFAFLIGPSGAGKTSLFKLIAAYEKISSGDVSVLGYHINSLRSGQVPFFRRKIGFVLQNYKLLRNKSVAANVELPLQIMGVELSQRKLLVEKILDDVGLYQVKDQFPDFLSGGEQQRVAIARALVHRPEIIIADEPTGNLDPELSQSILKLFFKFSQQGTTFLVATHDYRLIGPAANRVLKLNKGLLVEDLRL